MPPDFRGKLAALLARDLAVPLAPVANRQVGRPGPPPPAPARGIDAVEDFPDALPEGAG